MENSVELIKLDSVETYNNIHGFETLNPLVSVVDISDGSMLGKSVKFDYGIYARYNHNKHIPIVDSTGGHPFSVSIYEVKYLLLQHPPKNLAPQI